jgi:hypothetical protein
LWKTDGSTFFKWNGTSYSSIALLRQNTGFELVGFAGNPKFVNAAGGDLRIQATSPAVDAAIRLPGINDYYLGAAPDAGAYEIGASVGVGDRDARPTVHLDPLRPNPAPGMTRTSFALPREARVTVRIYDVGGRMVRELADGAFPAGDHALEWDGGGHDGRAVPGGLYLLRLEALGEVRTARILRLR